MVARGIEPQVDHESLEGSRTSGLSGRVTRVVGVLKLTVEPVE